MLDLVEQIRRQLDESCRVKQSFSDDLLDSIAQLAKRSADALSSGKKILLFGNGGSAADAQHIAAELVVRLRRERPGLPAMALTTNSSILTAAANDYGFEFIFARQIEALAQPGDILVALSTSGTSPNIIRGMETGGQKGLFRVAFTGETGGVLADLVELLLNVPSRDPQRIQEAHITIGHIVCSLIERLLFPESGDSSEVGHTRK